MYSDWFHYAQHPVRNGVYQIQVGKVDFENQWFRKFADGFWYSGAETPQEAAKETKVLGTRCAPDEYWRGVTKRGK